MANDDLLAQVLSADVLIGAVKWRSRWRFFAGTLGEWTLDYPAYDPSYRPPAGDTSFRGGLLRVDTENAEAFCEVMEPYELQADTIARWVEEYGRDAVPLVMVIDFDSRLFVHGYSEPVEPKSNYIPLGWRGIDGDPYSHVPAEVGAPWN